MRTIFSCTGVQLTEMMVRGAAWSPKTAEGQALRAITNARACRIVERLIEHAARQTLARMAVYIPVEELYIATVADRDLRVRLSSIDAERNDGLIAMRLIAQTQVERALRADIGWPPIRTRQDDLSDAELLIDSFISALPLGAVAANRLIARHLAEAALNFVADRAHGLTSRSLANQVIYRIRIFLFGSKCA